MKNSRIRIGISGWTYKPWRGVFYPADLRQKDELAYASRQFSTIEINGTHYRLQTPQAFRRWRDATPEDFVFSVKSSRYITHLRRLRDVQVPLANFLGSGLLALEEKLGPILWQFPPRFRFEAHLMEDFLALLPKDTESAAHIAASHDDRIAGRALIETKRNRPLRHCVEIRHESFLTAEFFEMLRRHRVAFVFADTAGKWPYAEDLTTDFVYVRLHGAEELYVSGYSDRELNHWAERLELWLKGEQPDDARLVTPHRKRKIREAYVYFDNDAKVKAPANALRLMELLDVPRGEGCGTKPGK